MRYIPTRRIELLPKGWDDCPSIDRTGSITGMIKRFGWKRGHSFRVGSYIFHFTGEYYEAALRLCEGGPRRPVRGYQREQKS